MEGLTAAFMFAVVTLLARISWDLLCVRDALEKGQHLKEKHPGRVRRSPKGGAERVPDGTPGCDVTQPLPKVPAGNEGRD